jgi:Icc-related predicted phosphoesterase
MTLLIFSDIHGAVKALTTLLDIDADYYFAAGDLANWGRGLEQMGPVLARRAQQMYVMPGNHESESDVVRLCSQFKLHNFHGATLEVGKYRIAGLGYSNPTPFDTPGEYSEDELARRLKPFEELQPLILICHCPPKETSLDRVREGVHAGSTAVKEFLDQHQPDYFFCGHIHEAAGVQTDLGRTYCRNVGKSGYLLEI